MYLKNENAITFPLLHKEELGTTCILVLRKSAGPFSLNPPPPPPFPFPFLPNAFRRQPRRLQAGELDKSFLCPCHSFYFINLFN